MPAGARLFDRGAAALGRTAGRAQRPSSWRPTRRGATPQRGAAAGAGARRSRPPAPGEAAFNSAQLRRHRAAVVGRPCLHQPACRRRRRPRPPWSATSTAPRPAIESETHHIVLDFGTMPFPVLEGQSIGIVPPGTDAKGKRALRAPVLGGQPAQRRAARLQQPLADREARAGGPPGQAGARRGQSNYVCDLQGGRHGAGGRALRLVLS